MTHEDQHALAVTVAVATSKWYRQQVSAYPTITFPYPEMTYTTYAYHDALRSAE